MPAASHLSRLDPDARGHQTRDLGGSGGGRSARPYLAHGGRPPERRHGRSRLDRPRGRARRSRRRAGHFRPAAQRRRDRGGRDQDRRRAHAESRCGRRRGDACARSDDHSRPGAEQNTAKGLGLLKRAAATGSSAGERDLAQLYLLGAPGVAPDRNEALKWLGASARHGDVDAMVSLGYLSMYTPIGVSSKERNLAESYCWLMRAALLDDPQAQEKLSMTLVSGDVDNMGTTIGADLVQADFFCRLAARSPYHDNSQIRGSIEPKMTTAQLQDAKRLLESWQPRAWVDVKAMTIPLPAFSKAAPPRSCPAVG